MLQKTPSGQVAWRRRKIAQVLDDLKAGDTLVVSELSRLGRSMLECMEILSIAAHKGINLYAVKGEWQLDGSMQSKIMAMVFAMAAEIERDLDFSADKGSPRANKRRGSSSGDPADPAKANSIHSSLRSRRS